MKDLIRLTDLQSSEVYGIMDMANKNAVLNPCPPFYRGEEVSDDVMQSEYFVGV